MARLALYIGTRKVGYTQKAEINEEMGGNTDPIKTFDGPVPSVADAEASTYEISFDLVRYEGTKKAFLELKSLINSTRTNPQPIKVVETVKFADGTTANIAQQVDNCKLSTNKWSFDIENNTINNLAFKGTGLKEFDGTKQIY